MRTAASVALLAIAFGSLAACVESADDEGELPPTPHTGFAGTWEVTRTMVDSECAFPFQPQSTVRMLIEGDSEVGYTGVEAFNIGTPGNPGTFTVIDGVAQLDVGFQEYWRGGIDQPDVAPGVGFVLRESTAGLTGTSDANAYYSVDGELVHCTFDFTLTAVAAAPL